jgi:hypothetical protein
MGYPYYHMEKQETPPDLPWNGPEYSWIDTRDPAEIAESTVNYVAQLHSSALFPNAAEIRNELLTNHHEVPPGVDIERANHFSLALGMQTRPTIILPGHSSWKDLYALMDKMGIPWIAKSNGRYFSELEASILYPPSITKMGFNVESAVAHENVHASGSLFANIWNEGFARAIDQIYSRLNNDHTAELTPPYDIHDIGLFAVSHLCDQDPALFESMLNVVCSGTKENYLDLFNRLTSTLGARRFAYLLLLEVKSYDSLPDALRGIIPDEAFAATTVPLDAMISRVKEKLTAYEQRTGYSFNFPGLASGIGAVALDRPTEPQSGTPDPIAAQINRITGGFRDTTQQ